MIANLMMVLLVVCVCLQTGCDGVQVGDSNSAVGSENESNIDSNNVNVGSESSSGRICIRCESEDGLESLGYSVEDFLNCTDQCGLVDGEDEPEAKACDIACIDERLEIASEVCKQDNGCESEEVEDGE